MSWKEPEETNGIISDYLVFYNMIGPATVTTPSPDFRPIIADHVDELLSNIVLLEDVFYNYQGELDKDLLTPVTKLCDALLSNETVHEQLMNFTDISQSEYLSQFNVSELVTDWMILTDSRIGAVCSGLLITVKLITETAGKYFFVKHHVDMNFFKFENN